MKKIERKEKGENGENILNGIIGCIWLLIRIKILEKWKIVFYYLFN